ncbi:uncharacterized protein LOC119793225 [Cyprinodon tularosa]|uniref:uncharacterized protein LOC119793225 n=1 Tax=Cyprinodon tularosa TaxID=77115 RepID=UPI0018E282CC|nr:uncharacterized protein LOC119793225 [Cyprinodon tularosa]
MTKTNPFYSYYKELTNKRTIVESPGSETSEQADVVPVPLPPVKFLNSPQELGYGIKTTENGAKLSKHLDVPQRYDPKDELFRPSSLTVNANANGDFGGASLKKANTAQPQRLSKLPPRKSSDNLVEDVDAIFRSSKDSVHSPQMLVPDPFSKTTSLEADLFPHKDEELFNVNGIEEDASKAEGDLSGKSFKEKFDIFSSSSTNGIDPFPSPLLRNSFNLSSLDDPFGPTPSKQFDYLQDGFSSVEGGDDIFKITSSNTVFSTPLNNSPLDFRVDSPMSDIHKKMPAKRPPVVPPKPPNKPRNLVTTPQESKENILQPTPFILASSLSSSPSFSPADMDHAQTFKRPPRPLPRTRRPRAEKPQTTESPSPSVVSTEVETEMPEFHVTEPELPKLPPKPVFKPPPKPVPPYKPKNLVSKPLEPENSVVFEDILLIGQEHCVEDWPEDSPELNPDFKPSGKFKLRRESMKEKTESDGGSSEDPDGAVKNKKKNKNLRMSLLSRRSSKETHSDDMMEGKSNTLPIRKKSSKEFGSNGNISTGDDEDHYSLDYKKKPRTKVNNLFRRASVATSTYEGKNMNGHLPEKSKEDDSFNKSGKRKNTIVRRQSESSVLDKRDYEEAQKVGGGQRKNSKVKIKFVPQRGFAITLQKPHDEPKGAYGYTPRKDSKDELFEDSGAHGYTPRGKLQDDEFEDFEEIEYLNPAKAAIMEDEEQEKSLRYSPSLHGDEAAEGSKERKHKKSKYKIHMRKSKAAHGLSEPRESCSYSGGSNDDDGTEKDMKSPAEGYDEDPDDEIAKLKKQFKFKVPKKYKRKSKKAKNKSEAASDDLSEAAKAAWAAAQMDEQAAGGLEEEEEEDEEDDGDTDSLMEWWYTVEKWDELPSDEEDEALREDESKSFSILAEKVERGLRLFNKVFTEQAEVLWQAIISLHTLADDISEFHHKAKIAGISGGTTTAVGTVTAITGLALAPLTFGASLLITAVGVGVATAGGITSASAAISDNVHNKNDRKQIEEILQDYEDRLLEISKILHFVNQGLYRLRGHPFLRSGTQHYSQDWDVRKAVQMISMVDSPVMRATEITDEAVGSLQGLFKGMDKYFTKETRELKKSCTKEIVSAIRQVANVLNDCIVELNTIREELQDATGQV